MAFWFWQGRFWGSEKGIISRMGIFRTCLPRTYFDVVAELSCVMFLYICGEH
jgi:hypothetical protein